MVSKELFLHFNTLTEPHNVQSIPHPQTYLIHHYRSTQERQLLVNATQRNARLKYI